jgi:hypothetical protein
MTELVDVILGGTFHAAVLFLVAAGLQLVFGVQKIVNLACGSFYALGAYFGITAVGMAIKLGMPPVLFLPVLIVAGLAIGLVGLPIERVLRTIYRRDESYQLLITFGFLLMFQDVFRFLWGATPRTMDNVYLAYGTAHFLGVRVPTYNLLVIAASLAIAVGLGLFSRADQNRPHRARHRRKPRHGRGPRRQCLEDLRAGVHRGLHAGYGRRRAGGAVRCGVARYGGRARGRILCGGRDRRARQHARRAGRRARRRIDARGGHFAGA